MLLYIKLGEVIQQIGKITGEPLKETTFFYVKHRISKLLVSSRMARSALYRKNLNVLLGKERLPSVSLADPTLGGRRSPLRKDNISAHRCMRFQLVPG